MRFFSGIKVVNYPDTPDELMLQILNHALRGPQRIPLDFFNTYFSNGGGRQHPVLGDLEDVVLEINLGWDQERNGSNLVTSLIRYKLDNLVDSAQVTP